MGTGFVRAASSLLLTGEVLIVQANRVSSSISFIYFGSAAVADPGGGGGGGDVRPPCRPKKKKRRRKKKKKKSALGFVKSDHRSMMSEGRLNALLRLYVHKDIHLDFEEVVTTYGHNINIQEECCWVDRWMHDFLHVEHLSFLSS